jgi:hypothetical protein
MCVRVFASCVRVLGVVGRMPMWELECACCEHVVVCVVDSVWAVSVRRSRASTSQCLLLIVVRVRVV